ncbi:hypothetical protein SEA_AEGEUS_152 [Mycobacterium phage Aegeus]|nr:hypothetical protein SEA_BAUDELAIRE_152 [Mycobacterium phage Baudelaire]WKW86626.1 hypothetical protein SEA_AEGEUS_152 [Mycobacterium phage Aegeus]
MCRYGRMGVCLYCPSTCMRVCAPMYGWASGLACDLEPDTGHVCGTWCVPMGWAMRVPCHADQSIHAGLALSVALRGTCRVPSASPTTPPKG